MTSAKEVCVWWGEGLHTALASGTRDDSHLPQELGEKLIQIPSWEEKNTKAAAPWRSEPRLSQGEISVSLPVEEQ